MILKASQRGGGAQLARHLLRTDENDHVEIHDIRGFVASDLHGAFKEAHAISRGTKCRQFLFSLSLSPPEVARAPIDTFEKAIAAIEEKVGLAGQPRAIIFHEKEGRRHAHCVWSRIDATRMKAINIPHFKMKLRDISRELYLEQGWQMPRGLMNTAERNPLNFTIAEWQQAKRTKQDPRVIKQVFQSSWNRSDSVAAFAAALKERGYYLARGDRRGFVALDWQGEIYSVARMIGRKVREVNAKLGEPINLPSIDKTRAQISKEFTGKLKDFAEEAAEKQHKLLEDFAVKRQAIAQKHRAARADLSEQQQSRQREENSVRAARLPRGIKALWFRVTGKYRTIRKQNELAARQCKMRDRDEMQSLMEGQLHERRGLQDEKRMILHRQSALRRKLELDMRAMLKAGQEADGQTTQGLLAHRPAKRMRRRKPDASG